MIHFFRNTAKKLIVPSRTKDIIRSNYAGFSGSRHIVIGKKSVINYVIVAEASDITISLMTSGEYCDIDVVGLFFAPKGKQCKANIQLQINDSHIKSNISLISFVQDDTTIDVDGSITIQEGNTAVQANLLQTNVVLGDKVHIKNKPILNVSSNDVQASHGAKIEKMDDETLLYMTSRGLTPQQSQKLVIQGYLTHIMDQLSVGLTQDEIQKITALLENIQKKII